MQKSAARYALQKTVPVFFSYLFVGVAYGITMREAGFQWPWTAAASTFVYAGSFQFVLTSLMQTGASFLTVAVTALLVNSRHLFYGLSYIEPFRKTGKMQPYLVFALTDETYSVYCSSAIPPEIDEKRALTCIALLDHLYWIGGSVLGSLAGALLPASLEGVDFAMTALFVTILVDQCRTGDARKNACVGTVCAVGYLCLLGPSSFMLPALATTAAILAALPIAFKGGAKA